MPKHPQLILTEQFVHKLSLIKKRYKQPSQVGQVVLKELLKLVDEHIYDAEGIPKMVLNDHLLVKEPSSGMLLSHQLSKAKISIGIKDIMFEYDLTRPPDAWSKNYALFPCQQESKTLWKLNVARFKVGVILYPNFGETKGNYTAVIGEQVMRDQPITSISMIEIPEKLRLPYLNWVQTDRSKALNALMHPKSSYFNLPNELKRHIFDFCMS